MAIWRDEARDVRQVHLVVKTLNEPGLLDRAHCMHGF